LLTAASEPSTGIGLSCRYPLATFGLAFGVLAYIHWAFGVGAVVLALLSLHERKPHGRQGGYALAAGALIVGIVGSLLNVWFAEVTPHLWNQQLARAQLECRDRLQTIYRAIQAYRKAHDGRYPRELADLTDAGLLAPDKALCPGAELHGAGPAEYLYFRPPEGSAGRGYQVLAAGRSPEWHGGRGGWVLRRNGRVEWLPGDSFLSFLVAMSPARGPTTSTEP
jgi:hypothetical protein